MIQPGTNCDLRLVRLDPDAVPPPFPSALPRAKNESTPPPRPIRLLAYPEIEHLPKLRWLIPRLFYRASLIVTYGEPGAGKSFLSLGLAVAVARSESFRTRQIAAGKIVYIAGEGLFGLRNRLRARVGPFLDPADLLYTHFFAVDRPINLLQGEHKALIDVLNQHGVQPDLIVVDTLARSMPGGDENSAQDMGLVVAASDELRDVTGAAILVVHHTSKSDAAIERGSSALRGAADTMLLLSKAADDPNVRVLTCTKQKDGPEFDPIRFRQRVVELGEDDDGEPLSSCVLDVEEPGKESGVCHVSATPQALKIATVLAQRFPDKGAGADAIAAAAGFSVRTFYRYLPEAERLGYVKMHRDKNNVYYQYTGKPLPG